jgi:hypothetical protein
MLRSATHGVGADVDAVVVAIGLGVVVEFMDEVAL